MSGDTLAINIPEFCPVSCKSPECAYRCDRSWQEGGEVPNLQQQRCGWGPWGAMGCYGVLWGAMDEDFLWMICPKSTQKIKELKK